MSKRAIMMPCPRPSVVPGVELRPGLCSADDHPKGRYFHQQRPGRLPQSWRRMRMRNRHHQCARREQVRHEDIDQAANHGGKRQWRLRLSGRLPPKAAYHPVEAHRPKSDSCHTDVQTPIVIRLCGPLRPLATRWLIRYPFALPIGIPIIESTGICLSNSYWYSYNLPKW